MDTRAIGVFDSGLGGLTALKSLSEILPEENFIYLGDTLRVPYGDKSHEELLKFADDDIRFLLKKDVKAILIACGTVSSTLSREQFEKIPVLTKGVVIPSCLLAKNKTKNKKIGIIATSASIKAGAYKKELLSLDNEIEVFEVPCPKFVPLIEGGADKKELKSAAEEYLIPLKEKGIDTLILGCTHYPLILDSIKSVLDDINYIDVGSAAAYSLKAELEEKGLLNNSSYKCDFFVSGNKESFKKNGSLFLNKPIENVSGAIF